ncbi:hypothetical protein [uncultured Mediterranean phage uvMED]|nr:hypothetical protein [uncultured Mediterranean phage uvMED]
MTYRAEPVPDNVDEMLAEFLDRQFFGIDSHLSRFIAPVIGQMPMRREMGAIVYVREQGFYGCVEENGDLVWKKLNLT